SSGNGAVMKIDPVSNHVVARQKLHGWISDLAVGGRFLWAAVAPDVFELDENDLRVQGSKASGPDPRRISFGDGVLWIAGGEAKAVSRLETASQRRTELATNAEPSLAQFHDGLVWTSAGPVPAPLSPITGPELRVSMPGGFLSADPSTSGNPINE